MRAERTSSAGDLSHVELALGRREERSRDDFSSTHVLDRSQRPTKPTAAHNAQTHRLPTYNCTVLCATVCRAVEQGYSVRYRCQPRRGGAAGCRRRARTQESCAGMWAIRSHGSLSPTRTPYETHTCFDIQYCIVVCSMYAMCLYSTSAYSSSGAVSYGGS